MECPNCQCEMQIDEELSRGMGNQSFQDCPVCGTVALVSGKVITQYWSFHRRTEKGVIENASWSVR